MRFLEISLMKQRRYNYDISRDVDQLLVRSAIDIEIFRGKTIFITGGTGFFGVWFLHALAAIRAALLGELRILVLSRSPDRFLREHGESDFVSHMEFVHGDIKSFKLPEDVCVTHLIHMATTNAEETFAGEDQLNKLDMLYSGTRHVLEECGRSLESVLFTSSGVAYGVNYNERIIETDFTAPDTTDDGSALGLGKLVAEYLVAHFANKFGYRYSLARCFAFSGQYLPLDLHYAFGNFIKNVLDEEDIVIRGDGKDLRSYLYIGDAIAWLLKLLADPRNNLFNIGSSRAVSIEQLAHLISSGGKCSVDVLIKGEGNATGNFQRPSYIPAITKVLDAYPGLSEWTSLEEVVQKMLEFKNCLAAIDQENG